MMERKKKLRIIQLSLLFLGLCIILFTYSENKNTVQKKEILPKTTKEKINKELKGKNQNDEANVFYNISYSGIDLSGNRYVLKSKIAKTRLENDEIIDMTEVEAVFYFKDNTKLNVSSKFGQYNNKTLDMSFKKNVKANYQKSVLFAEAAEYSNSKSLLTISDKVRVIDTRGNLKADKLSFDLKNQTLNISSVKSNNINAKVNLDEKRF